MLRPKSTAAASDGAPGMRSRASRQGTLSVITSRSTEVKSLYCWSSSTTGSMVELSTRNASTGSEPDGAHAASGAARQRIRAAWPTMLAGPRLTTTPRRDSRRMSHRPPESGPLVVEGEERSLVIGNRSRNSPRPTRCTIARRARRHTRGVHDFQRTEPDQLGRTTVLTRPRHPSLGTCSAAIEGGANENRPAPGVLRSSRHPERRFATALRRTVTAMEPRRFSVRPLSGAPVSRCAEQACPAPSPRLPGEPCR